MDPSSLCSQGVTQSEAGHGNGGLNQGGSGLPLECSGIDQVRPSLGSQLQKPSVETTNQCQLLILQQPLSPLLWQPSPPLLQPLSPWSLQQVELRCSSIQASSPKVSVDSQDQKELTTEVSIAGSLPTNPSHSQGVTQSIFRLVDGGLNQGGSGLPLKCSGIDQVRPSLGSQLQKPFVETTNQFQLLRQEQQQHLLQQLRPLPPPQEQQQHLLLPPLPPPQLPLQQQQPLPPLQQQLQLRGSSIQASSPKVRVDSQDQEELTMEASTIRSLPINPSSLYSQGVTQSKSGLVNGGGSSFDDINGIQSPEVRSKCKEKLWSNTSSPVDNGFDQSHDMGSDEINLIGSQTPKVKSKRKRKCKSLVWQSFKRKTGKDGKERAQCKRCDKEYLIDSRTIGTSTLRRHEQKCSGQLEPKDQGPEPIQEENIIEARTPERPCVPQAHISPAVQRWTLSSPVSGVLGTTSAVTTKRRRLAEMHTESDTSIWSKTSAFQPTSHDSANKSAGTEADEGKSSTPPAATEEEVQAPRDPQLSLATTKSGPQEESGSVHKQFASAEELRSIAEPKKAWKITPKGILDSLSKGQIECLGSGKIAVDVVLSNVGSAVDVNPLEAIITELFVSLKQWQSIQDPALLYENEVLDRFAILRRELNEEFVLQNEEESTWHARCEHLHLYKQKSKKHIDSIFSSLHELDGLDRAMLRRELDEERELENEEQSSWIDRYMKQMLLDMDRSLEHKNILLTESAERVSGIKARIASKIDGLVDFVTMVDRILGVGLESADPEVAAQRYAAHKREAMKAQLQDFSRKINDFSRKINDDFKE